jgi:hypothetical protein
VQKLSYLNYKIMDKKVKVFVVQSNRLKKSYDETPWSFENTCRPRWKTKQPDTEETLDENVEIQSRPIATGYEHEPQVVEAQALGEEQQQIDQDTQMPENGETPDTDGNRRRHMPDSSAQDPDYEPPNSPLSRRELATTPIAPPLTRSRARLQLQENPPV